MKGNQSKMTMRFNTPMIVPDLTELTDTKVALRWLQATTTEVENELFATESGISNFEIRSAIEVNMATGSQIDEPIDINFSWEITKFTPWEAEIQIYFDIPEAVSASGDTDYVEVTFWADDLFRAENGKTIARGFTVRAPVIR